MVDTGFNRFLTLPRALAAELGLRYQTRTQVILANGSREEFDIYGVTTLWDGQPKEVVAHAADATPLVGMALLDGYDLSVEVVDGGHVAIQAREQQDPRPGLPF